LALIPQAAIDKYAAGPSSTKVTQVANLQTTIRSVLDYAYDSFLQGSYRNDTAIADINDVDIVARRKGVTSPLSASTWEQYFETIASALRSSPVITGTVSIGDKCVKLATSTLKADIVPAVAIGGLQSDPVSIWSRRRRSGIPNYPRTHYEEGVKKQSATDQSYKATTRLFKRWVRQYGEGTDMAPSFYIECAVHAAASDRFHSYLPRSFFRVGSTIASWTRHSVIKSVAGDKDILTSAEWRPEKFEAFKVKLIRDLSIVHGALTAKTTEDALKSWKSAFGDF
jgi:hypothetical protein